jgi:hypothetical protein
MTINCVRVVVTSVLREAVAHTRSAGHFISSGDTLCVNVRGLQLGRLCESSIVWEQILSHFKRRKQTTDAHMACFKNVGLELLHTKHDTTPLFDMLQHRLLDTLPFCVCVHVVFFCLGFSTCFTNSSSIFARKSAVSNEGAIPGGLTGAEGLEIRDKVVQERAPWRALPRPPRSKRNSESLPSSWKQVSTPLASAPTHTPVGEPLSRERTAVA